MTEIVRGVVAGGWSVLVGWVVPALINTAILVYGVVPGASPIRMLRALSLTAGGDWPIGYLLAGLVAGLVFMALQVPLYRVIEGYLWPRRAFAWGRSRRLRAKRILERRLELATLASAEGDGTLDGQGRARLAELRADPALRRWAQADTARTAPQRGLLRERLHRFPVDDDQVIPTRLGNAIRRLEEYGYDRYRLDSQVFWYELSAVVPEQARRQVDNARIAVDFFVCLLYGHLVIAAVAVGSLVADPRRPWQLSAGALVLCALARAWYHAAVSATDEWATAVRGMVNLGRAPLARSLGLELPRTITDERAMWTLASKVSRLPYDPRAAALDRYRTSAAGHDGWADPADRASPADSAGD